MEWSNLVPLSNTGGFSHCRDFYLQGFLNCESESLIYSWSSLQGIQGPEWGLSAYMSTKTQTSNETSSGQMIVFLPFWLRIMDFFLRWERIFLKQCDGISFPQVQPQSLPKNTHSRLSHQGPLCGRPMFWYKGAQTEAVGEKIQLLPSFMRGGC